MRSVLHGRIQLASAGANLTRYTGVGYARRWNDGQGLSYNSAGGQHPWSAPGTLRNFYWELTTSPTDQGLTSLRYRLFKNGVATGVDITLTGTDTIGTDNTTLVTLAAGDYLYWQEDPSPAFPSASPRTFPEYFKSCEFDSDEVGVSVSASNQLDGGNSGDFTGFPFTMDDDLENDADEVQDLQSFACTITRYDVRLMDALTGAQTVTVTPYKNGIAQDGAGGTPDCRLTLVAPDQTGAATFSLSCVRGDRTYCQVTASGFGGATPRMSMSAKIVAAQNGQFWVGGREGGHASTTVVNYNSPTASTINDAWEAIEADARVKVGRSAMSLRGLIRWIKLPPGTGRSWTLDVMRNGTPVSGGPVLVLADAETQDDTETGTVALGSGDTYSVRDTPANTPDIAGFDGQAWAFVGEIETLGWYPQFPDLHWRRPTPMTAGAPVFPPIVGAAACPAPSPSAIDGQNACPAPSPGVI